jgi:hypothetical protein
MPQDPDPANETSNLLLISEDDIAMVTSTIALKRLMRFRRAILWRRSVL